MKNPKGFIGLAVLILLGIALIGGGAYIYSKQDSKVKNAPVVQVEVNSTSTVMASSSNVVNNLNEVKDEINKSAGKPIIKEIIHRKDSQGNDAPAIIVDPYQLNNIMRETAETNPWYKRASIELTLLVIGLDFRTEASLMQEKTGTYESTCNGSKAFFEKKVDEKVNGPNDPDDGNFNQSTSLGIKMSDYRLDELKCVWSKDWYILWIPLTRKDGSESNICVDKNFSVFGDADMNSMTCIRK